MSPAGPTPPPEEKLLRLIRGQGASAGAPAGANPAGGLAAAPRARRPGRAWSVPSAWVMVFNALLGIVLVAEAAGWWWLMRQDEPTPPAVVPSAVPSGAPAAQATAAAEPPLPLLASVAARAMFRLEAPPAAAIPMPSASTSAPASAAQLKTVASRLSLVGIIAGEPGEAIIEDAQTQKTYSVTVGQQVVEGVVLEAVRENRAVLSLDGEKIELSL